MPSFRSTASNQRRKSPNPRRPYRPPAPGPADLSAATGTGDLSEESKRHHRPHHLHRRLCGRPGDQRRQHPDGNDDHLGRRGHPDPLQPRERIRGGRLPQRRLDDRHQPRHRRRALPRRPEHRRSRHRPRNHDPRRDPEPTDPLKAGHRSRRRGRPQRHRSPIRRGPELGGLDPDTAYRFRISATDSKPKSPRGPEKTFNTFPTPHRRSARQPRLGAGQPAAEAGGGADAGTERANSAAAAANACRAPTN